MCSIDDLATIQKIIFRCVSDISYVIRCSYLIESASATESNNNTDKTKNLDLKCNEIIKKNLNECSLIRAFTSEKDENMINVNDKGKYLLSYDPLDGLSNIKSNITVRTIFCIFEYNNNTIINGYNIVMSGYSLYGGSTQLVICKYGKVNMYNLNPQNDNWMLLNNELLIEDMGSIYSINESNKYIYNSKINNYIDYLIKKNYTTRWIGWLVADFHRILLNGGIVAYPSNKKNNNGKIRLLYEAYPLAYIMDSAGGKSSDGSVQLLKINFPWNNIHQKTPIFYGSYYEMNKLNDFLK